MIQAKPAGNMKPVYFEWDETFKVMIKGVPAETRQTLLRAAEMTTFDKRHQKTTDTDWLKYGKAFLREAIAGWVGMTYRYLLEICEPIELAAGIKLDDPIEFSEENLAFVLKNYRIEFSQFVTNAVGRLNEIYIEQKKKELENLPNTSGGK